MATMSSTALRAEDPFTPRKACVTGGAGFIGSHVVECLAESGIETVVIDDLSMGKPENLPTGVKLIVGDVCDNKTMTHALGGVDVVFHLAARVSIRGSFRSLVEDARSNIMGTVNLLHALGNSTVRRVIYASSMAVYGEAVQTPMDESHPLDPASPYGIAKLAAERYLLTVCPMMEIRPVILRYFNTYGIRQTPTPYVGVITIFIRNLLNDTPLTVFGDGEQIRDFVHVRDVAKATVAAMRYKGQARILNVGSGKGISVNTLAKHIQEAMGKTVKALHVPPHPGEPRSTVADIALAKRELAFSPDGNLQGHLPELIEWHRGTLDPTKRAQEAICRERDPI